MCLANFSMVITSEYWDTAKAFFFSVFTRLMSAWSGFLPSRFCLVDTWFCLIDSKEVTVHWAHGNAVINHTFCVFWWLIFQFPRSPVSCPSLGRYWCLAPYINRDSNVSSVKTDFRYKRSFLSIAGAKVQQFGVENKFFRYRFSRGVCKCLTDNTLQRYFGNQLLHFDRIGRKWRKRLRILEKRSFPVMVISGHGHFRSKSFSGALGHSIL